MKQNNNGDVLLIVKCMPIIWTIISPTKVGLTKSSINCPWLDCFFNEWSKENYIRKITQFQKSIIFAPSCALMNLLSKVCTY